MERKEKTILRKKNIVSFLLAITTVQCIFTWTVTVKCSSITGKKIKGSILSAYRNVRT